MSLIVDGWELENGTFGPPKRAEAATLLGPDSVRQQVASRGLELDETGGAAVLHSGLERQV